MKYKNKFNSKKPTLFCLNICTANESPIPHPLVEEGFMLISRLRDDADLKYIYLGKQRIGRPRKHEGKINFKNLDLSTHKTYYFGDVNLGYNLSAYDLGFNINLRNISNTKMYRNNLLTDYYQSESAYNLFPRMLLLGVNFKL